MSLKRKETELMIETNGQKYNRLLKKSRDTGMVNRLAGSSRPQKSAALEKMVNWSMIWFSHRMVREISCKTTTFG